MRIDIYLVEKNYFKTRSKARSAIELKTVFLNNKLVTKPSLIVKQEEINIITVSDDVNPFVSKGGLKLQKAIDVFKVDFNNKIVCDIGASTGGFTDCALQNGAQLVYSIDVGTNQLDEKLLNDKRVLSFEKTNFIGFNAFKHEIDIFVSDVSFVSIKAILPSILKYMRDFKEMVILLKPQFEVGKSNINKNGIVKDYKVHKHLLNDYKSYFETLNLKIHGLTPYNTFKQNKNIEYLIFLKKNSDTTVNINVKDILDKAFNI